MGSHLTDIHRYVPQCLHGCPSHLYRGDSSATRHHDVEPDNMCETVVQGQNDECAPFLVYIDKGQRLLHVGRVVPVGKHHALGVGRSAAGVCDCRQVVIPY